ncbi:MAG: maleylacetoacetate isomerase [Betaproteobacteria bacterium]
MKLYDYFRSSAAYRVRIALNIKGLTPERAFVHLRRDAQRDAGYLALNPQGLVPSLSLDDGRVLTQSLAIIEYLDEAHPQPALLPAEAVARARVRAIALEVACDIHPLNNLRVLKYLKNTLHVSEADKDIWYKHWVDEGLAALELRLTRGADTGRFCHGDMPTLADVVLVPQLANARRFDVDVMPFPTLRRIEAACVALPAFAEADPTRQPDAE